MSSINEQQKEKNHEDLQDTKAIKKIKELANKASTCFFCTSIGDNGQFKTRPMSVQEVDDDGNYGFLALMIVALTRRCELITKFNCYFKLHHIRAFLQLMG